MSKTNKKNKHLKLSELTLLANDNNNYNNNNHKLTKEANICFGKFFPVHSRKNKKTQVKRGREMNRSKQKQTNAFHFQN